MKKLVYFLLFLIGLCYAFPQGAYPQSPDLSIKTGDLMIEESGDGGFHLWIRAKEGIKSVMITESTADPDKKSAAYSLRAKEFNDINGNEVRILDGKIIEPDNKLFFLIDSTPESHEEFGSAFHIFIPYIVEYGYPWSRNGEIYVHAGTFLNLRAFEKEFCDYTGSFLDNPYMLDIIQIPSVVALPDIYMDETVENFTEIADETGGKVYFSTVEKLMDDIGDIIDNLEGETIDIVFAIDTTESMINDIDKIKRGFPSLLENNISSFKSARTGVVFYKDYNEEYLTKPFPFTDDSALAVKTMNSARVWGGKDIPEAVYEALYECVTYYDWSADERIVILIGDAPAHLKPRGRITKEMVFAIAEEKNIDINTIILPP